MKITIRKPLGYTQIGRKDQQEDAVWPLFSEVTPNNPCIVLCDGVGGSKHGEIASQTSSKVIGEYLTKIIKEKNFVSDADMQQAVNLAYDELEKIDNEPAEKGTVSMATTLTCVCLHKDGILAAHMGDSRIYHVRPGQGLLYQSDDHSLVNALLKAGELTIEEAKNFPRKNVITKAIQPHTDRRFKAEVQLLTDVQSGDYIFLCCDGVLEQLTNERLIEILSMNCSDKEKLTLLEAESTDKTRDNYTAYLIHIDKVIGVSSLVQDEEISTVAVEVAPQQVHQTPMVTTPAPPTTHTPVAQPKRKNKKYYVFALLGIILLTAMFCLGRCSSEKSEKPDPEKEKVDSLLKNENSNKDQKDQKTEDNEKTEDSSETSSTNASSDTATHNDGENQAEQIVRQPLSVPLDKIGNPQK